jgi:serine/threonine-protein kinase
VSHSSGKGTPPAPGVEDTASNADPTHSHPRARVEIDLGRPGDQPPSPFETDQFVQRGLLGRGGSGVVVRALDKELLREVAIKILSSEFVEGSPEAERFIEEARITGQLEHPNIVPIYEIGVRPTGHRFLCLRLLEGRTLEETLHHMGASRLEPDNLASLLEAFSKVCDAIAFAHSRGVVHRDLKPLNIMLSDFGQVYVLDWGIARRLARDPERQPAVRLWPDDAPRPPSDPVGALMGTPSYMAPEQIRGQTDAIDERTDVFALGATLYQILAGAPPMSPESIRSIWMRRSPPPIDPPDKVAADSGPRRAGVPPELARIAMRALAFDPAMRYATVTELKRDVEQFQRGAWHLPRKSFAAGATIVSEGEEGRAAYVIEQGQCTAFRVDGETEVVLRVMGPGEVFGETAVFTDKPRTASVRATTDVVVLVVTSDVLAKAVGLNSWMGAFVKALADRFREADERLRVLERASRGTRPT